MGAANPKGLKVVLVEWEDATGISGWVNDEERVKEMAHEGCPCETVGFVLEKTDEYILLAMCISHNGPGEIYRIPHGMIRKVKPLK